MTATRPSWLPVSTQEPQTVKLFVSCGSLTQEKLLQAEKHAQEMQERFGVEEAKTIEMGAELLTLVNQKLHLDEVVTQRKTLLLGNVSFILRQRQCRCRTNLSLRMTDNAAFVFCHSVVPGDPTTMPTKMAIAFFACQFACSSVHINILRCPVVAWFHRH